MRIYKEVQIFTAYGTPVVETRIAIEEAAVGTWKGGPPAKHEKAGENGG